MDNDTLLQEIRSRGYASDDTSLDEAVNSLLSNVSNMPTTWVNWKNERKVLAAKQVICFLFFQDKQLDVEIGRFDGLMGPLTQNALDTYDRVANGGPAFDRPFNTPSVLSSTTYVINNEARKLLPTQAQMMDYYGNVGSNQVEILLPYRLKLSWEPQTSISKMTCHKKAASDFAAIFETILTTYGQSNITDLGLDLWGGTLNVRKMRGGTSWSMHAWGSAIDLDPDRNGLKTKWQDAQFSKKEYIPFINAWLGMGWISLGYEHNHDAMHFQRARIR